MKLHDATALRLSNLAILTGMNGMGKSSVIQTLLLLRQSFFDGQLRAGLNLKGDLCYVGTADELACQSSDSKTLDINLSFDSFDLRLSYLYPDGNASYDTYLYGNDNQPADEKIVGNQGLFSAHFQYLSAFRFGPMKLYERDTLLVKVERQISKSMGQGEYAIHFLHSYSKMAIPIKELAIGKTDYETDFFLQEQVERWLKEVSPNVKIEIEPDGEFFKLKYKFIRINNIITGSMSAINTGFGVTYVLPILVAVLSAKAGALIIIENPEAHIHPSGQAALMRLISLAAKNGVQIILETHSDHIIHGALIARKNNILSDGQISIHYFERDETKHTAISHELTIKPSGKISKPPSGFFDQFEKDLSQLTGI